MTENEGFATDRDLQRREAIRNAATHVVESLARQDARSPRDAAIASLGQGATELQITEWITRFRSGEEVRE